MEEETLESQVIRNSIWTFSTTLIGRIGGLIFTILLARFLLPEGFGVYSLVMSVMLMFLAFGDLGLNHAMIRYVSNNLAQKKIKKASAYLRYLTRLKITVILVLSISLLVLAYPLSNFIFHKPFLVLPLIFSSFYLLVSGMDGFYSSLFYVFNKVRYLFYKELVSQILRIVLVISVLFLISREYYVLGIIFVSICSTLFILLFALALLKRKDSSVFQKHDYKIDKKELLKFIGFLAIGSFSVIFFSYIDILMIGIFIKNVSYVGYYRAAFSLVTSIAGLLTFISVLLPVFGRIEKHNLNEAFNKVIKYTGMLAIPAAFGLVALGRYFIRFIYGYEYLPATIPLYFLSFIIIEATITGNYYALLTSKGKPHLFAKVLSISTVLNVVLNLVFILIFIRFSDILATSSVAAATLLSRYFYLFAMIYIARKNLGIKLDCKNILKPLIASVIMAAFIFFINLNVQDMTIFIGSSEVLLGFIIYFAVLLLIKGLTKEDLQTAKRLFTIKTLFRE